MNTIHRRPGSFFSGSRRNYGNCKKRSDLDFLFDVELLTVQQVAKWAKVPTKSVYRWIESGDIPAVKFGERTYRIPARAVIAQLKASGYEHLIDDNEHR